MTPQLQWQRNCNGTAAPVDGHRSQTCFRLCAENTIFF